MRALSLLLACCLFASAQRVDLDALKKEAVGHLQALVRLDTTNPPGNETRAVEYLKKVLEQEGIAVQVHGSNPQRMNLIARLKGSGAKKPLLLMGHTDTVGIDPKKWVNHGPFSADRDSGYIYGRGSNDDKDSVAAYMTILLALKRSGAQLDRDIIFLAEAGEEAGTTTVGIKWLANNHPQTITDAEFCLAEGGAFQRQGGKLFAHMVGTAEKVPRRARLIARGTAGHGSRPTPDNPIVALASAVAKVAAWTPPMRLNETTQAYFERRAAMSSPEKAKIFNMLQSPATAGEAQAWLKQNDPLHYATVTTTVTPTILKGGFQMNVIPSEAEATLDIRALPDENMDWFFGEMKKVIGNANIEIDPMKVALRPATKPSGLDTPVFRAIEKATKKLFPEIRTIPMMQTGATDMAYMRELGTQCYGVGPAYDLEDAGLGYGAHSDQERILEEGFTDFVGFAWEVVNEVAAKPR